MLFVFSHLGTKIAFTFSAPTLNETGVSTGINATMIGNVTYYLYVG